ncbi:MAG: CCA tRNA nucleotidyltransferase [Nitrososphaerota archaeon]|jgi:tRNA nucleotidyltransferase (CCA-adding enzyme)|nr:CCA tRNA nucleotidyltransferase [Nitrososphaerota archaeon]MDG6946479.1 CCA tRNA nucleotidyltransferase [Nitrososphaerota archaeon]MDG6947769.1 CCA tRNA nucleotidyltransferase [Nitrososphaerota archaeon]
MTCAEDVAAIAERGVVPSHAEAARVRALASSLVSKTEAAAARHPQARGVLLGGSFAKGTWLPRRVDLDIFVKFDPSTPEQEFERVGLEIGEEATRGHPVGKKFAQHPYTEATVDGVRVNIVPCFDVRMGEWKSAADRSPFHVELIKALPEETKAQVRLLKAFMEAVGVYGAEIRRQGFSGYVAEVLVMKLGGFRKVAEWFASYPLPREGKAFTLMDPVDDRRDLGTAVSAESLGRMVLACREFLRRPATAYFSELPRRARSTLDEMVMAVVFSHAPLPEDTLWGELRKTTKHLVRHLEEEGFRVARSLAASDNLEHSAIILLPELGELPALTQRVGPTVDRQKDVEAFLRANSKISRLVWVDGEARVRILIPREYTDLMVFLTAVARGRAGQIGASKEVESGMKRSARVLRGRALSQAASRWRWLRNGVREITSDVIGAR